MEAKRFTVEDLLDFTLDVSEEENDDETKTQKAPSPSSLESSNPNSHDPDEPRSFDIAEEELEWLSNKDAFPAVETCLDLLTDNPVTVLNHQSPVSVLENNTSTSNSSTITSCFAGSILVPARFPVKARSKRRCRRRRLLSDLPSQPWWWWGQAKIKNAKQGLARAPPSPPPPSATTIGRRCYHCLAVKTPQWRAGPMGPKTLCNACGVRYKSGRLVPEYRPADSPTFSSKLHSNSHRKVMEMRRQKQMGGMVNEACGYSVG
ncbi:GATA transcription factor 1 [Actinidia rufa]|uniref:GATA transcription factor 1 n=1 Tax=Actinidia rufa TaxID=165716 RepID=A0A7J0GIX3_9ERIC|nr:GATA transcription factor 1 [Actinidia rufa]